ncbi:MAG TPA: hypothetical protein VM925_10590 [Labilithrix sp.]|nr:hypothetical protein [Labilithrix sp.]
MEPLHRDRLLAHHGGRHFASEPHLRIQVLPVAPKGGFAHSSRRADGLFDRYHGELLIICLAGTCTVTTETDAADLREGDQALLCNGEAFRVDRRHEEEAAVIQLVWSPGPNPCRACWETDRRFFEPRRTPTDEY